MSDKSILKYVDDFSTLELRDTVAYHRRKGFDVVAYANKKVLGDLDNRCGNPKHGIGGTWIENEYMIDEEIKMVAVEKNGYEIKTILFSKIKKNSDSGNTMKECIDILQSDSCIFGLEGKEYEEVLFGGIDLKKLREDVDKLLNLNGSSIGVTIVDDRFIAKRKQGETRGKRAKEESLNKKEQELLDKELELRKREITIEEFEECINDKTSTIDFIITETVKALKDCQDLEMKLELIKTLDKLILTKSRI